MTRTVVVLVLMSVLVGGCGAATPPTATGTTDDFPPTQQVRTLDLPFDQYSPSLADLYTIANAEDRLTRTCMRAAGLDWTTIARPTAIPDFRNRRRYGVIELPIAQQFGFHVPPGLLTSIAVERQYDLRDAGLSASQKAMAFGENGCASRAAQTFQNDANTPTDRLAALDRKSLATSLAGQRVSAALNSYRGCLSTYGYHYTDPFAALSDSRWWADDSAGPSTLEKAVAVADVECKAQSRLVDVWHSAEIPIQQAAIRQNAAYFQHLRQDLDHRIAQANTVLARP